MVSSLAQSSKTLVFANIWFTLKVVTVSEDDLCGVGTNWLGIELIGVFWLSDKTSRKFAAELRIYR